MSASASFAGLSKAARLSMPTPMFSDSQARVLAILMAVFSTVSIVAGSLSLYWFARMRRAFRHHLIMLLILSNLWRALWYFLFPIVSFTRGAIETQSTYCQLSGFMLSFGIQGADFVVLTMAIHAALCIFNTSSELRESGLYPYRRIVYALWIIFPALCCSLAFINKQSAYATTGAYCYLPVFPIWYRLALSWIPRYIILITIAVVYLSIFLYVKREFSHLRLSDNDDSYNNTELTSTITMPEAQSPQFSSAQEDPDVIESATPTVVGSITPHLSGRSTIKPGSVDHEKQAGTPLWENYTFGTSAPLEQLPDSATLKPDRSKLKSWHEQPADRRGSDASRESISNIIMALEECRPTKNPRDYVRTRHRAINRQMRMVFIYPLAYFISWIVPFVSHCLNYNTYYASHPKLGLLATANVILALQCTLDTVLFSIREKPWRKRDSDDEAAKTFWGSIMPWRASGTRTRTSSTTTRENYRHTSNARRRSLAAAAAQKAFQVIGGNSSGNGVGRTKGQNAAEAMAAKERKNAETVEARQEAQDKRRKRQVSLTRRGGVERSWWEVEGKRRNDSVLLGDDGGVSETATRLGPLRTRKRPSIGPIGEEQEPACHRPAFVEGITETDEEETCDNVAPGSSNGAHALHINTRALSERNGSEVSPKHQTPVDWVGTSATSEAFEGHTPPT